MMNDYNMEKLNKSIERFAGKFGKVSEDTNFAIITFEKYKSEIKRDMKRYYIVDRQDRVLKMLKSEFPNMDTRTVQKYIFYRGYIDEKFAVIVSVLTAIAYAIAVPFLLYHFTEFILLLILLLSMANIFVAVIMGSTIAFLFGVDR